MEAADVPLSEVENDQYSTRSALVRVSMKASERRVGAHMGLIRAV